MDELEISGKRYISTRRAAKEYKYHSDYIGQLIRGKKLLGRKVGRSWYVELESLTTYFGEEGQEVPTAPLVAKAVEVVVAEAAVAPIAAKASAQTQPVEEKKVVEKIIEQKIEVAPREQEVVLEVSEDAGDEKEIKIEINKEKEIEQNVFLEESPRESIHIPIRRTTLTERLPKRQSTLSYISDDSPALPKIKKIKSSPVAGSYVMPRDEEEAKEIEEEIIIMPSLSRKNKFIPIFSVAMIGVAALGLVMLVSVMINSHTVIEAGKTASVGYSLQ